MAKIQPIAPIPVATTTGSLQVSTLPTGVTSVQKHPNNFRSTSESFRPMNNKVVQLDNQYDSLPAPTKAAWEAKAVDYIGTPVCGCKLVAISGKKLYRLQNFMRALLGLVATATPADFPAPLLGSIVKIDLVPADPPFPAEIDFEVNAASQDWWIVLQQGKGLNNPQAKIPAGTSFVAYFAGDPLYDAIIGLGVGAAVNYCTWQDEQAPTGTGKVTTTPGT